MSSNRITIRPDYTIVKQDPKTKKKIEIKLTDEQIEQLKALDKPAVKLRPDVGDKWFKLYGYGHISIERWDNGVSDNNFWNAGNGFFTQEEAIKEQKYRIAKQKIKGYKLQYDDMENAPLKDLWTLMWRDGYFYPDYEHQYGTEPPDPDTSTDAEFQQWAIKEFGSYIESSR